MKPALIDHVAIVVADLESALPFFVSVLGLSEVESVHRENLTAVFLGGNTVTLELIEIHDAEERERRLGAATSARFDHLAFRVESLREAITRLEGAGYEMAGPPRDVGDRVVVFLDSGRTGGIRYQFVEAGRSS